MPPMHLRFPDSLTRDADDGLRPNLGEDEMENRRGNKSRRASGCWWLCVGENVQIWIAWQ